jgi:hypothetical protein
MLLQKLSIRVVEMHTIFSEPLEFPTRDENVHRLPAASHFYFDASFGLIDNTGQTGSGFGDGIPM